MKSYGYTGPEYGDLARLRRAGRKHSPRPAPAEVPCERHPGAPLKERTGRLKCSECLREQDARANYKRDAKPVCLLADVWK